MIRNLSIGVVQKQNLPRRERGRWVGALSLRRLFVPERVGLGDQLMAVENRKNANLVVDGLVDDAVG